MKTRIIAFLLVLCMAILAFASCGGEKQPEETKGQQGCEGDDLAALRNSGESRRSDELSDDYHIYRTV